MRCPYAAGTEFIVEITAFDCPHSNTCPLRVGGGGKLSDLEWPILNRPGISRDSET
jgi:hypothetical protein